MTLARLKPPPIRFDMFAWSIPDERDRLAVRGAYRELRRCGLEVIDARCVVIDLLAAGMNGRSLVVVP